MLFGKKHTCARSDAMIRKVLLTTYFCYVLTAVEITGRKLLPVNTENQDPILESRRSPLYETRNNLNNFQIVNEHPADQHFYLDETERHLYEQPRVLKRAKYAYILKENPGGSVQKGQLYRIAKVRGTPSPTISRAFGLNAGSSLRPTTSYDTIANTPPEDHNAPDTEGKKYAFAYAVRPKDGYTTVADDFNLSHKESRDGKVTMGEYKVLLPDGRLQIVRYTADGKTGFKADVTYEADEGHAHSNEHAEPPTERHTKAVSKPSTEIHHQYVPPPPQQQQQSPSPPSPSHKTYPYVSKVVRTHPSLSPSLYYQSSGSDDHHYLQPQYIQHSPSNAQSPSPTPPQLYYKVSPSPYSAAQKNPSPTPGYVTLKRAIGSTVSSLLNKTPNSTPKSIYDKIHNQGLHYAPVMRGQRAGPATNNYVDTSPTLPSPYEGPQGNGGQYHDQHLGNSPNPVSENQLNHYSRPIVLEHPSDGAEIRKQRIRSHRILNPAYTSGPVVRVNKSALVPYRFFKAGPELSETPVNEHGAFELGGASFEHAHSHEGHEPHYVLQEVPHEENFPAQHHRLLIETRPRQIPPVKSSLATFKSNLVHAGISTPKPPLYVKPKRVIPVGRPIKPSVGGLVYLETPASGPRPTALGVKEILATLRHDNLPRPKTTTHPYELGSKDYGNNVGYSPATEDSYKTIRSNFKPSQEIPQEYLPHNHHYQHRQYLLEREESEKEANQE